MKTDEQKIMNEHFGNVDIENPLGKSTKSYDENINNIVKCIHNGRLNEANDLMSKIIKPKKPNQITTQAELDEKIKNGSTYNLNIDMTRIVINNVDHSSWTFHGNPVLVFKGFSNKNFTYPKNCTGITLDNCNNCELTSENKYVLAKNCSHTKITVSKNLAFLENCEFMSVHIKDFTLKHNFNVRFVDSKFCNIVMENVSHYRNWPLCKDCHHFSFRLINTTLTYNGCKDGDGTDGENFDNLTLIKSSIVYN